MSRVVPSADDAARAIIVAARLAGEDPFEMARRRYAMTGRPYAYAGLAIGLGEAACKAACARAVGYQGGANAGAAAAKSLRVAMARATFDDGWLDEIAGAVGAGRMAAEALAGARQAGASDRELIQAAIDAGNVTRCPPMPAYGVAATAMERRFGAAPPPDPFAGRHWRDGRGARPASGERG
jgi:hypothetical protein